MDSIVAAACELLDQGQAFIMATIFRQQGSAPRTSGARMLITAEQQIVGTIGGGLLEANTITAAARMSAQTPARILAFDLTSQDAAKMEMICGGRVQVLLDYIAVNDENLTLFDNWRKALSQRHKAMLVSVVSGEKGQAERIDHGLLLGRYQTQGPLEWPAGLQEKLSHTTAGAPHIQVLNHEGSLVVADPGWIAPALYIFGAGHVALPTSRLASMVGFAVTVVDDRAEFADRARFPEAAAVRVIPNFNGAIEHLTTDRDTYIIIVTRGHLHDKVVLAQALKTSAAYIGMIGSRRKRDIIYKALLKEGFTDADIARVHCPIGLSIGADTPEEIAVSIAAELIAVRSGVDP